MPSLTLICGGPVSPLRILAPVHRCLPAVLRKRRQIASKQRPTKQTAHHQLAAIRAGFELFSEWRCRNANAENTTSFPPPCPSSALCCRMRQTPPPLFCTSACPQPPPLLQCLSASHPCSSLPPALRFLFLAFFFSLHPPASSLLLDSIGSRRSTASSIEREPPWGPAERSDEARGPPKGPAERAIL